jgi:hypothetical protein
MKSPNREGQNAGVKYTLENNVTIVDEITPMSSYKGYIAGVRVLWNCEITEIILILLYRRWRRHL